ncbi:single-stranded-DNA-specific exonuclease RecJ [bacterium]|nr:single-stranded-DNA-specific exonuclease RecJ [bacterium]
MSQSVIILPEIPIANWYSINSERSIEDQIIDAIIGKIDPDNRDSYFNSALKDIPNPSSLKDIDLAADIFINAIRKNKNILVVGDYDVDGITATALLIRFFIKLGFQNYDSFIPNRFIQGYGLTDKTVEIILSRKPDLVITVDNGITAKQEIARIKENGIEVIVTDHHLPQTDFLPECPIINPKQDDCRFPFKYLAGVGVVFLFLIFVRTKLRDLRFWNDSRPEPNLLEHLDLVALGTVADQVPLLGLNRVFTRFGLDQMTKKLHEGYPHEFFNYIKIYAEKTNLKNFNSETIAFGLAPMINAAGRMKDAEDGLKFLLSEDEVTASSRYQYLDRINQKRRKKQQTMAKKAQHKAKRLVKEGRGIVVYDESFHEGLIGVIASRLVDEFHYPSIVMTDGENGILKASCRSQSEDIMDILKECDEYLVHYGGHSNAAGFAIDRDNLEKFHDRFTRICDELIPKDRDYVVKANIEVKIEMMTYDLIDKLRILEPFGHQNRKPVFYLGNMSLPVPTVLTGKHLKWRLQPDLELIFWNGADTVKHSETYDIACTIGENIYRGERKRQMIVRTIVST